MLRFLCQWYPSLQKCACPQALKQDNLGLTFVSRLLSFDYVAATAVLPNSVSASGPLSVSDVDFSFSHWRHHLLLISASSHSLPGSQSLWGTPKQNSLGKQASRKGAAGRCSLKSILPIWVVKGLWCFSDSSYWSSSNTSCWWHCYNPCHLRWKHQALRLLPAQIFGLMKLPTSAADAPQRSSL